MTNITQARQILQGYGSDKATVNNYPAEMEMINSRLYSSGNENVMVEMIDAKDRLIRRVRRAERAARKTENALARLSPYERDLLFAFYVAPVHGGADRLSEKHSVERATVYRDKDKALKKIANWL